MREVLPLFVYGTLTLGPILAALLGRAPAKSPAKVKGYMASDLAGLPYPGLVPCAGALTEGLLLKDLTANERKTIHLYEDTLYTFERIRVDTGETETTALSYLLDDRNAQLALKRVWDRKEFWSRHGPVYVELCKNFQRTLEWTGDG